MIEMRKTILSLAIIGIVGMIMIWITNTKEDFEIYNSYKISSNNYETTVLQVIVNKNNYNEDEIFPKIYEYYRQIGTPDKLTINLYKNKKDLEKSNCLASRIYEKK